MFGNRSIRYATIAAIGIVAILWAQAGAAPPPNATVVLEVKVLEARVNHAQQDRFDVLYRMEVLSVLSSASRVEPGETIRVRSYGQSNDALEPGWIGTTYLNPDPMAAGPGDGRQFVIAAQRGGVVDLPPTPPSATITIWRNQKGEVVKWD